MATTDNFLPSFGKAPWFQHKIQLKFSLWNEQSIIISCLLRGRLRNESFNFEIVELNECGFCGSANLTREMEEALHDNIQGKRYLQSTLK